MRNPYIEDVHSDEQPQHNAWNEGHAAGKAERDEVVEELVKAIELALSCIYGELDGEATEAMETAIAKSEQ